MVLRFGPTKTGRKAMKLLAASIAGLALLASPVLAQPDTSAQQTSTTTTHVKSTTKHIHATNVPRTHHAARMHHHAMRCGCPPSHMRMHAKTHHVVKKTTTTTSSSSS
jgi:hypothetical protein